MEAAVNPRFDNAALVQAAHLRLAEIQVERNAFDFYGHTTGKRKAHAGQVPPDGDWFIWLMLAGRGFGKTRGASEWIRSMVKLGFSAIGFIGPTAADVRDTMVEGPSGILAVCHSSDVDVRGNVTGKPIYESSKRRVTWQNGAQATLFSSEKPDRLRGPNHQILWADEICFWEYPKETWDMAMLTLRLPPDPRCVVSTTPKAIPLIRELVAADDTRITKGSTYDNKKFLSRKFYDAVTKKYEGTTLGRQELYAEILEEAEGALWRMATIDRNRIGKAPDDLKAICVSIDPAVTAIEGSSNQTGIIVAATDGELGYVLEDATGIYKPLEWAQKSVELFRKYSADYFLAETNQGGDLISQNIRLALPTAPIRTVHAQKGKYLRAEPVAALYEQDRVKHVHNLGELETEMVSWEPLGKYESPDRLDALVHAITSLMLKYPDMSGIMTAAPRGQKIRNPYPFGA